MSWMFPLMLGGEARHPSNMLEYIFVVYTKHSYVKFFLAPSIPDTFVSGHCPPGGCYGNVTYIYIYLLPDVKIIHYFLRRKPYFKFEIKKSTQRPTKYYNSARSLHQVSIWRRRVSSGTTSKSAEAKSLRFDLSSGPQGFIKVTFSGNVMYPPVNE